jgi:hypothetical protein
VDVLINNVTDRERHTLNWSNRFRRDKVKTLSSRD